MICSSPLIFYRWTIDVGWTSTWVRIVNEWLAVCVYCKYFNKNQMQNMKLFRGGSCCPKSWINYKPFWTTTFWFIIVCHNKDRIVSVSFAFDKRSKYVLQYGCWWLQSYGRADKQLNPHKMWRKCPNIFAIAHSFVVHMGILHPFSDRRYPILWLHSKG